LIVKWLVSIITQRTLLYIASHFVPYDELVEDNGTVKDRYEEYLTARATVIWKEIKSRTE